MSPIFLLVSWAVASLVVYWGSGWWYTRALMRRILGPTHKVAPTAFPSKPRGPNSIDWSAPPICAAEMESRRRRRWFAFLIAGVVQMHCCAWIVLIFITPDSFSIQGVMLATLFMVGMPILLQSVLLLRRAPAVGPSGRVILALMCGLVFAAVGMVTVALVGDSKGPAILMQGVVLLVALLVVCGVVLLGYHLMLRLTRLSPVGIAITAIWLVSTFLVALVYGAGGQSGKGFLALLATTLVVFWPLLVVLLRRLKRLPAVTMLFLRTIPRDSRRNPFFLKLANWWTEIGPVELLAGSDSAVATADVRIIMSLMTGRLRKHVVTKEEEVQLLLAKPAFRLSRDGRYEVNSVPCGMDVWQQLVVGLMERCRVVVMDLRGFGEKNLGCQYEIEALGKITKGAEVTFVVDDTTDTDLLKHVLLRTFGDKPLYRVQNVKLRMKRQDWLAFINALLERRVV